MNSVQLVSLCSLGLLNPDILDSFVFLLCLKCMFTPLQKKDSDFYGCLDAGTPGSPGLPIVQHLWWGCQVFFYPLLG